MMTIKIYVLEKYFEVFKVSCFLNLNSHKLENKFLKWNKNLMDMMIMDPSSLKLLKNIVNNLSFSNLKLLRHVEQVSTAIHN